METVDDVRAALAAHDYLADEGLATAIFLASGCSGRCCSRARPASARPRWPRSWPAGPAASWSGSSATRASTPPRRSTSGTTPASCCTCARSRPAGGEVGGGRALLRALPRAPAAAPGHRLRGRQPGRGRAAGAADRRGRPGRRRVRGVPARDPLRLLGHRPRAGHVPRRRCRRSSSSRRTAPATCTTRSKRRCLYHWVEHPDFEREVAIVRLRGPEVSEQLARQVAAAVEALRELELYKPPGVAETIDWAEALAALGRTSSTSTPSTSPSARSSSTARTRSACGRTGSTSSCARRRSAVADVTVDVPVARARPAAVGFARLLRAAGLDVPVGSDAGVRRGARPRSASASRDSVYWAGRATLVRRPEDVDALRPRLRRVLGARADARRRRRRSSGRSRWRSTTDGDDDAADDDGDGDRRADARRCATAAPRCCATRTSPTTRPTSSPRRAG